MLFNALQSKSKHFFILLLLFYSPFLQAIDCNHLNSNQRIVDFIVKSKHTNPLMNDHLSVLLDVNSCERDLCLRKNLQKRLQKRELIHIIKIGKNERLNIMKGENAPQCYVKREAREFKCESCELRTNSNCRSYKSADNSTKIKSTNIDKTDFKLIEDQHHRSTCEELQEAPKYLKIITKKVGGGSKYDTIITFIEKSREIPITMNFLQNERLYKVYRFFPRYYIKIENKWYSTYFRSRTTIDSEKRYIFETVMKIVKDKRGNYHLYPKPEKDPLINKSNYNDLFKTD